MDVNTALREPNTPSRLRPPKARKPADLEKSIGDENCPPLEGVSTLSLGPRKSPRLPTKSAAAPSLPPEIPQPTIAGDRMVKTYKTSAAATSRPPVTKPISRPAPRTAAISKSNTLSKYDANSSIAISTGHRPLWDKSGRLEEMARELESMKARMETTTHINTASSQRIAEASSTITELEAEKQALQTKLRQRDCEIETLEEDLRKMKRQLENERHDADETLARTRSKLERELSEAMSSKERIEAELISAKNDLKIALTEIANLKATVARQGGAMLESDSRINSLTEANHGLSQDLSMTRSQLSESNDEIKVLRQKLHDGETLRRKLHNLVQELKGNIRVFCRIRPLLKDERPATNDIESALRHITCQPTEDERDGITLTQSSESAAGNSITKAYPFTFDRVFTWNTTQGMVFEEISQLVQSALDGYRVCIFAYGQTGSGKTFTMEGNVDNPAEAGMIPRAVQQIFTSTEILRERGWTFKFECSYLEIYNETIRDLLVSKLDPTAKYDIKHIDGQTMVTDLMVLPVSAPNEIMELLRKAATNRAVGETHCNERSSRSHSVFTLKISGQNEITTEKIEGLLHLVDLAGSERLSQSGSTGDRLKETQAINKSLSSLGDVIHALANREAHIPYRNSKLTYLLQHSLGGNCKTLMFVNVNPTYSALNETLCSLRFASKVNACTIGTATRKSSK